MLGQAPPACALLRPGFFGFPTTLWFLIEITSPNRRHLCSEEVVLVAINGTLRCIWIDADIHTSFAPAVAQIIFDIVL